MIYFTAITINFLSVTNNAKLPSHFILDIRAAKILKYSFDISITKWILCVFSILALK